jgi:putative two-component system response regulator
MSPAPPPVILVVDDAPANLQLLSCMLKERGYKARPVPNGRLALQAARNDPPDLVLLDINMPGMNGFEVCAALKADARLRDIPVIFVSALHESLDKVRAFGVGGVDFVTKPFHFEEVQARVEAHLQIRRLQRELAAHNRDLEQLVQGQVADISESQMATIFALAKLAESRDDETRGHVERIRTFTRALAARLHERGRHAPLVDAAFVDYVYHASPLHDIGKVGIPDAILFKREPLTPAESEVLRTHTMIGVHTLEAVHVRYPRNVFVRYGIDIARSHHERWRGGGYPDGLAGEAIPLAARIVAVADSYDAMTIKRCYKDAWSHEQSCAAIVAGSGDRFDPAVVEAFVELAGEFGRLRGRLGG